MDNFKKLFKRRPTELEGYTQAPVASDVLGILADAGLLSRGISPRYMKESEAYDQDQYKNYMDREKFDSDISNQNQLMGLKLNEDARAGEKMMRLVDQQEVDNQLAKDQLDLDRQYKLGMVANNRIKAGNVTSKPSEGKKTLDREFAKTYEEWTGRGKPALEKNYNLLDQTIETLKQREKDFLGTSGRVTGRLPDWMRSDESIRLRDDVHRAVQSSLKATLGPQFTEREGDRIMKQSYNEKLSPSENIRKIESTIKELKQNELNNDSKARYFEDHNYSLDGWKPQETQPKNSLIERKTKDGRIALFDASTKEFVRYKE
jgi:hypothetical protein